MSPELPERRVLRQEDKNQYKNTPGPDISRKKADFATTVGRSGTIGQAISEEISNPSMGSAFQLYRAKQLVENSPPSPPIALITATGVVATIPPEPSIEFGTVTELVIASPPSPSITFPTVVTETVASASTLTSLTDDGVVGGFKDMLALLSLFTPDIEEIATPSTVHVLSTAFELQVTSSSVVTNFASLVQQVTSPPSVIINFPTVHQELVTESSVLFVFNRAIQKTAVGQSTLFSPQTYAKVTVSSTSTQFSVEQEA